MGSESEPGGRSLLAVKIVKALVDPRKWVYCLKQLRLWAGQAVRYGNFSLNPNTRKYWDTRLEKYGPFWRIEPYENILDILPRGEKFTLLDIGCALGDGCELIKRTFPSAEVTGADFSRVGIEKAVRKAREKGLDVLYRVMDVLADPIPGTYDYIIMIETLEHFYEPYFVVDKCLKNTRRALIVSVPYDPQRRSGRTYSVDEHVYTFDDEAFARYKARIVKKVRLSGEKDPMESIIYEIRP